MKEAVLLAFGLLVLAHVSADFLLQGKHTARKKDQGCLSGYFFHGLVVWLAFMLVFLPMFHWRLVLTLTLLVMLHIGQDVVKGFIAHKAGPGFGALIFLLDQGLHLMVLMFYWLFWLPINGALPSVRWSVAMLLPEQGRIWWEQLLLPVFNADFLAGLIIYIAVVYGGAVFVRKILDISPVSLATKDDRNVGEMLDTGRYIGMAERTILLTFMAVNAVSAVAFVLTAKSIARYQELNQKDFAEYYLVGTMSSTALALAGGAFLRYLWSLI